MGLPLSLEGIGKVLKLENQKMAEGKALIRYFCVPCKPTKANGGRMRNLPEHDPVKWSTFIAYNKRDVETEMAIQQKLSKFPVPDFLWEEYHLDQEINDRGIQLDMVLVEQAIAIDERSREELSAKMQQLTALENPNSVQQMKEWLTKHGLEVDSLDKKAVKELLKTAPPELAEVLELRRQGQKRKHTGFDGGEVGNDKSVSVPRHKRCADEFRQDFRHGVIQCREQCVITGTNKASRILQMCHVVLR